VDVLRRTVQITESATEVAGHLDFGTTKTHQSRTVHLPAFVSELLGRHLQDIEEAPEALVFPAPRGGPLRYPNMRKTVWDRARERSDEDLTDVTPHDLRHTCASLMRAAGADVKAIQQQLGHRSATVTLNTYTHLFEGDLAAVMDRLDTHAAIESRPERVLGQVVDLPQIDQNPR
jgi:integrase